MESYQEGMSMSKQPRLDSSNYGYLKDRMQVLSAVLMNIFGVQLRLMMRFLRREISGLLQRRRL